MTAYYAACVEAGPSLCAIYNSSADAIRGRVDNLIARAQVAPIPVYVDTNASAISFGVVDATTIMQQLFTMLDYPFSTGPAFAEAIVQLEQGNGSAIFQGSDAGMFAALDTCEFNSSQPFQSTYLETITPILCGDNLNTGTLTLDQSRAAYEDMLAVSQFAPVWYAQTEGPCAYVVSIPYSVLCLILRVDNGLSAEQTSSTVLIAALHHFSTGLLTHIYLSSIARFVRAKHEHSDSFHQQYQRYVARCNRPETSD